LVGKEWLHELVDLLRTRRQIILYGPPGTGKTYLALEVASALTDPANVTLVQFHPAFSYEDFFEGYRPTAVEESGRVGFALTPGPFRKVVDQAREDPGQPYILVVDEINRANLAKVFGELYFLLEYRDRSIDLMYASGDEGRDFSLPKNVYLIGTMNTADRSIALVDAAMRRRFAFLSLHPDDPHMRDLLRDWLTREGQPTHAADLLDEMNSRIPDRDFKVGPSYLMRPDVATEDGLDRIWRTQILPLLEEMHYGDAGVNVAKRYGLASLRSAVTAANPTAPPPAEESADG
jgi:5-methylcytosine-specific restriction protein B